MPSQLSLLTQDLGALRALMQDLSDPVLLLDAGLQPLEANAAGREQGLGPGVALQALRSAGAAPLLDWLRLASTAMNAGRRPPPAPPATLPDGRRAQAKLFALDGDAGDAARWVLHLRPEADAGRDRGPPPRLAPQGARSAQAPAEGWAQELVQIFWASRFPAFVEDAQQRVVGANEALLELSGLSAEALQGQDFARRLIHESDRSLLRPARGNRAVVRSLQRTEAPPQPFRLRDAQGQERWMRASFHPLGVQQLVVLQDCTAEFLAREQAQRVQDEIAQWFEISPLPMVLFDEQGLLLRHNSAFAALCLDLPATLHDAPAPLQQLLGWTAQGLSPAFLPDAAAAGLLQTQATLADAQGRVRWCHGRIKALDQAQGSRRRFMAMIEDRSLEQERDIAHQQLDALMDTAGVGLATFQQDAGWLRPRAKPASGGSAGAGALAGLQGVSRDMVEPASLAEYERLQKALRHGERIEVRYAVLHPELGRRWLLTRVEPGRLASGQRTTSVVTQDISAQQQAQARSEQLLHELTTIMDSAGLGLAYLRGERLMRCNEGFARLLGHERPPPAGTPVARLFAALPALCDQLRVVLPGLDPALPFEAEFERAEAASGRSRWFSLSLRAVPAPQAPGMPDRDAIAVISDISRLKAQQAQLETLIQDRELMFSLSDVGIAILRAGRIERANDALAQLSGYRIEELVGLPLRALFESDSEYDHISKVTRLSLREQGLWRGERRVRCRDGRLLWMQVTKRVMRQGAPDEGLIATYVNVDDRWRAQQSLMLQTERERAVLDSVLVGIVTVGRGGIEWMNRSARRMFGGDLVEFLGHPMSIVATPDPQHPFRHSHYLDELLEGQAETFECQLQARDGREFWVVGNAVVTGLAEHGRQLTYALLDIERRRQAEAGILQAQASLQRIIEAAPLAISLHDARSLQVEKINQVAARLAGRPENALLGASPEQLFGEEQGQLIRQDMEAALQAEAEAVTRREYRLSLGGELRTWDARYLHLSDASLPDGHSEPEQLLLVASDVTEQREAEAARLQAEISQRELLVREVHHRIKNNLQGVAGLLQQIAARRPEIRTVINEAIGQVQAIAQVYGLQVGVAGPLRVRKVVEAITGSVQRMFGRSIECHIGGPLAAEAHRWALPEAESIPIALTLNELLTNAIKHSAPDELVGCELYCGEGLVELRIRNRGTLPPGFSLATTPSSVSGLGLVRALLPRRSARLNLVQQGSDVLCTLEIRPPGISLLDPL